MKKFLKYFTWQEWAIWSTSVLVIILSFCIFDRVGYLSLIASLIGITGVMLCGKGNPIGQVLIIVFASLYGIISYSSKLYGEMITYVGMSAPMALLSLISWLKNPYKGNKEVKVNTLSKKELPIAIFLTVAVTIAFYFILKAFGTAQLLVSTISVATSFAAVYLTFRRSPYYALAYTCNDIVLIVLWSLTTMQDISRLSVLICFVVFSVNDFYAFINWLRMKKKQEANE